MSGYYEKYIHKHVGDQWSTEEVDRHAKAMRNRIQLGYAIPLVGIVVFIFAVFLSPILPYVEKELRWDEGVIHLLVVLPILIGAFALIYGVWFQRRYPRRYLDKTLLKMGVRPKLCFRCGYALEGSVSVSCPECGRAIAPPTHNDPQLPSAPAETRSATNQ